MRNLFSFYLLNFCTLLFRFTWV